MANLQGFTMPAVGNMLNHFTRHAGDPEQEKYRYNNIRIDPLRTHLNYALFERPDPLGFISEKIKEVYGEPGKKSGKGKPSKRTNVMSSWIITLPRNERLSGREREFFETAYKHLCEKVGAENVVGAWIHMDETQPHMHFAFTPCVEVQVTKNDLKHPLKWEEKDVAKNPSHKVGEPKLDSKGSQRYKRIPVLDEHGNPVTKRSFAQTKMFDRAAMKKFHPELSKAMEDHFGFDVGIELDDPGDRALSKLEQPEYIAAKKTKKKLEDDTAHLIGELDDLRDKRDEIKRQADEEAARLEQLQRERIAAEGRVDLMESVAERCRAADAAPLGEKGGILGEIASACSGFIERIRSLLPERVTEAISRLMASVSSVGPRVSVTHDAGEDYSPFAAARQKGRDDRQIQKEKIYVPSPRLPRI